MNPNYYVISFYSTNLRIEFMYVQEEPQNMGAYTFIQPRLQQLLPEGKTLKYIGRPPSAAPATGIMHRHKAELSQIMTSIFQG